MIPSIGPISPGGIAYVALATGLVLLAWSPLRHRFICALALSGVVMAVSWLGFHDFIAMLVFQVTPFLPFVICGGKGMRRVGASLL